MHCTGVLIFCPAGESTITAHTVQSITDTKDLLWAQGVKNKFKWTSASDIEDLRNFMLTIWYYKMKEASHLLMVDKDMHFSPYMVWDMLNFDKQVTGVFYSRRGFPVSVVGQALNDTDTIDNVEKGHLKVKGVGGGVLLIKRSAIKTMIEKDPAIIDKSMLHPVADQIKAYGLNYLIQAFTKIRLPEGGLLSEDLSFCRRWREAGGDVWANVKHPIGHVGSFEYTIRYEAYLEEKKAEQVKEKAA